MDLVRAEFKASDDTYGYRRITARLGRRGVNVGCDTVRCLVRRAGLIAAQPRRKDLCHHPSRGPGGQALPGGA